MASVRKLHPCDLRDCRKVSPSFGCFSRYFDTLRTDLVYHMCPGDNCLVTKQNIGHVQLTLEENETLPYGVPFLDILSANLTSNSWNEVLVKAIQFFKKHRIISQKDSRKLVEEGRVFSITLGVTPPEEIDSILRNFLIKSHDVPEELWIFPDWLLFLDVEGQVATGRRDFPFVPAKIHCGSIFGSYLEINIPHEKSPFNLPCISSGLSPQLSRFFQRANVTFVGHNLMDDVLLINSVFTLISGEIWTFQSPLVDTCSLWVLLGGWDFDKIGVFVMIYYLTGGFAPKHRLLSCNAEWFRSFLHQSPAFLTYNLNDQFAVMTSLYVLLMTLIPSIFSVEDVQKGGMDPVIFFRKFSSWVVQQFTNVRFHMGEYQRTMDKKNSVLFDRTESWRMKETFTKGFSVELQSAQLDSCLSNMKLSTLQLMEVWPTKVDLCVCPGWAKSEVSGAGDLLKFFNLNSGGLEQSIEQLEYVLRTENDSDREEMEAVSPRTAFEGVRCCSYSETESVPDISLYTLNGSTCPPVADVRRPPASRIPKLAPRPAIRFNTSGYDPTSEELRYYYNQGLPFVAIRPDNSEYTENVPTGAWQMLLTAKEILNYVCIEEVERYLMTEPSLALRWVESATKWGKKPSPVDFRFGGLRFYRMVRRVIKKSFPGLTIDNTHKLVPCSSESTPSTSKQTA